MLVDELGHGTAQHVAGRRLAAASCTLSIIYAPNKQRTCSSEGMDRELGMWAQRAGATGGIVRADLQQCVATWDTRRFAGVRARLAQYLLIGSNDPRVTRQEVASRWYGTGADKKVEDRLFVCGATPLRRPSWTANPRPKLCFSERRSSKTPTLGETYSKNLNT